MSESMGELTISVALPLFFGLEAGSLPPGQLCELTLGMVAQGSTEVTAL